ncbi:hypothetical protein M9H77_29074 [Catharanthus roseus]|uniref:Uncharacterized protein n=1 Tax=Catharanthus roseus TaxID=4058 RepID=A0ACC0AHR7_CATRO|nr:hypothetical protein M9H77_29074 [Catharanthus roseus]
MCTKKCIRRFQSHFIKFKTPLLLYFPAKIKQTPKSMEEAWAWEEALDVDDSDLPSLLRPCKRRLHRQQDSISTSTSTAAAGFSLSQPVLEPCSNASKTQVENQAESPVRVLESSSSDSRNKSEQSRPIPGPAGAVQSAMLQKTIDRRNHDFSSDQFANPIATQEYIRRAVEDAPEFDEDFSSNAWISALRFVGTTDGVIPSIPLSSIKECKTLGKAEQVVAVIKSCTQNSLGGMMVTLKDPTGTIGASVHHKVIGEGNFGKDFYVGSVVILQKVAIFSASTSTQYLNILLRNVLKVFNKDKGSAPQNNGLRQSITYAVPGCSRRAGSLEKITPELGTTCQVMDEDREANSHHNSQIEEEALLPGNAKRSSRSSVVENVAKSNDPTILWQDSSQELHELAAIKKTANVNQGCPGENDGSQRLSTPQDSLSGNDAAKHMMMKQIGQETRDGGNQNQQLLAAATSIPQWTDEQLEELFAGDDD